MKKIISTIIVISLLLSGIFVLTGCGKNGDVAGETKNGVTLKLDMSHFNKKIYTAQLNFSGDQRVAEFDAESPETVRIESEKEKYVVDVTLDEDAKEGMEEHKKSAKECEKYTETKFGKYEGYSFKDGEDMAAYIILDSSDDEANIYLLVSVYVDSDTDEEYDIEKIFESSDVQKLINNVSYKVTTAKASDE